MRLGQKVIDRYGEFRRTFGGTAETAHAGRNDQILANREGRPYPGSSWHVSHPDHGVLRRILSPRIYPDPRDVFTTTLLDAPREIFRYLGQPFASTEGHILIRVEPGGARYRVLILDDSNESHQIVAVHGPYESR